MERIFDDLSSSFAGDSADAAVSLGNFDGVHVGHQALLEKNNRTAENAGLIRRVVTFEPHPRAVARDPGFRFIYSGRQKAAKIDSLGLCDELVIMNFTRELKEMEPEDYFKQILIGRYHAKAITVGDDFRFGRFGRGDTRMLAEFCEREQIQLTVMPRVCLEGGPVSSSRIREYLEQGEMELAAELLGEPYQINGMVHQGKHVGRKLHTPTVNLWFDESQVIPRKGVYVSRIRIGQEHFTGVSNVGIHPSFGGESPRVETFIFEFAKEVYGEDIGISLLHFLRPEHAFDSPEALKEQIDIDINHAKAYFKGDLK